eukprot:m.121327 g.121327  ORF g.121327 m.121327 type:complete len:54 (-) comp14573_c1_seq6:33-194(-)
MMLVGFGFDSRLPSLIVPSVCLFVCVIVIECSCSLSVLSSCSVGLLLMLFSLD